MPASRVVLLLIGLQVVCLADPVLGECDPSHAVVAVASVLSTLGFVIVVLALAFLVVRWRKRAVRRLNFGEKRATDGHVNSAYIADDNHLHLTEAKLRNDKSHNSRPVVSGISNEKTWSSLPRKDHFLRLSKDGSSYGSLNGNQSSTDPEVVSVTLESQDIIGLGFNICGGYNDGIRVSEINSRGPAKECGDIKVGDRILSVTVCYEHIVYEDALTILSYASPYPVKIRLQKASGDALKTFDGKKIKVDHRRLSHPLFRSRSLEAVKRPSRKEAAGRASHPKRTQSDAKSGHSKLLKWPGKHSKKEKSGGSGGASRAREDFVAARWQQSPSASQRVDVDIEHGGRSGEGRSSGVRLSRIQDSQGSDNEGDDQLLAAGRPAPEPDLNLTVSSASGSESRSPKVVPDKPERKNRRKSDVPISMKDLSVEDMIASSEAKTVSYSPPLEEDGEDRIVEEVIVPEVLERMRPNDSNVAVAKPESGGKDIKGALDILRKFTFKEDGEPVRSPSPDGDPVEEELIFPESKSGHGLLSAAPPGGTDPDVPHNNNNEVKGHVDAGKPKNLNEEILEMIIAMNSFPPGTQGWAGLKAGGSKGGFTDDFVPSDLGFVPQPVPKEAMEKRASPSVNPFVEPAGSTAPISLGVPGQNSNSRSLAYEIRDDLVTGQPFAVEINNKQRQNWATDGRAIVRSASEQVIHNHRGDDDDYDDDDDENRLGSFHTSFSFDAGTSAAASTGFDQATWNVDIGHAFAESDDWPGQRLVRSGSFDNIFIKE